MRDISELVDKQKTPPVKEETLEEMNRRLYLEDIAKMRDFSPPESHMLWPSPVGPKWKN
jgi:hypothetical protein